MFSIDSPSTLLVCTAVCKSWYSLLTSPSFITSHLNRPRLAEYHNDNNNGELLLVRTFSGRRKEEDYTVYFDNEAFGVSANLEFPFKSNDYFRIIGSCNGLVCFTDDTMSYDHTTILWNPSIRKSLTLPYPRVTFSSHGGFMHNFGFGFDPVNNDYKVIRIVNLDCVKRPEIDIFTVNTGTWRNITHLGLSYHIIPRKALAYVNGATHWLAIDRTVEYDHLIVSFNMTSEVFHGVNIPLLNSDGLMSNVDVVKFEGSLSLFERQLCSNKMNYYIWVMKEYGVAESWTKQMVVDVHGHDFKWLVGFRKNGQALLATRIGCLMSVDYNTNKCQHLDIYSGGETYFASSFYADAYKESLVLLGVTSSNTLACVASPHSDEEEVDQRKLTKGKEEIEEQVILFKFQIQHL